MIIFHFLHAGGYKFAKGVQIWTRGYDSIPASTTGSNADPPKHFSGFCVLFRVSCGSAANKEASVGQLLKVYSYRMIDF